MKNTSKNSRNKDTILYILLFLLVFVVVLTTIWIWSGWNQKKHNFEVTTEEIKKEKLGRFSNPRDIAKLPRRNRNILKSIKKKLINNFNPKLTTKEKDEIKEALKEVDNMIKKKVDSVKVNLMLNKISSAVTPLELIEKQIKEQDNFFLLPEEEKEAKVILDNLMKTFFDRFYQKVVNEEEELVDLKEIEPHVFRGEKINNHHSPNYNESLEYYKNHFATRHVPRGEKLVKFVGFAGWLDNEDKKAEEKEGKSVLGTTNYKPGSKIPEGEGESYKVEEGNIWWLPGDSSVNICWLNIRPIEIRLKKELFLNYKNNNYDEWISSLEKKGDKYRTNYSYKSLDISFDQVMDTIAHELAHAVIDAIMDDYNKYEEHNGGDKRGHGPLHTRYNNEIRKMIDDSPEGREFAEWWNKNK